uniref:Uncharacterized protein n=1 Tax=uncultured Helicobacter sp. TaxID=175537 RepID=A0A650EM57_9HELI|nr:hypothetical protein Helico5904_1940 [uncultured Helicobacter sp.]
MKKIMLSVALSASLLSVASAQSSGLFVGINAGVPITTPTYGPALQTMKSLLPTTGTGWAVGLDLGYRQALSNNMGLRYYLSYNYNQSKGSKDNGLAGKAEADINQHLITANIDYWVNFTRAFGAYIGIGVGYQQYNPTWKIGGVVPMPTEAKGGLAVPLNVGLTYNFNDAHQILLGAKIPLLGFDYQITQPVIGDVKAATLRTYIVQVGYNLTF